MALEAPELVASCHCGRSRITLPRTPDYSCDCNCSLCTKTGFAGIYFSSEELRIEGQFDSYVREDMSEPMLKMQRCRHCGTATHWTPLSEPPHKRMGVNANLLEPDAMRGVAVRKVNGRSWKK